MEAKQIAIDAIVEWAKGNLDIDYTPPKVVDLEKKVSGALYSIEFKVSATVVFHKKHKSHTVYIYHVKVWKADEDGHFDKPTCVFNAEEIDFLEDVVAEALGI